MRLCIICRVRVRFSKRFHVRPERRCSRCHVGLKTALLRIVEEVSKPARLAVISNGNEKLAIELKCRRQLECRKGHDIWKLLR